MSSSLWFSALNNGGEWLGAEEKLLLGCGNYLLQNKEMF